MNNLNKLFEIILPNLDFEQNVNLFLNKRTQYLFENNIEKEFKIYSTDTWMNMFPVAKYTKYCDIQDLFLNIKLNQDARIQILDIKYNTAFPQHSDVIVQFDVKSGQLVAYEVPNFQTCENLYLKIFTADENIEFKELYWGTTTKPMWQNKIAIVCCTYKREQFVQKNIDLFNDFIKSNPILKDKIAMFVIDNGKTLDKKLENKNIKIIPNINAGGAGGFTRGIIEVKKLNENYTRILLMDDDVLVFTESFYRTLIFLDYLRDKFKNSFINGAMLNLYKKNLFVEANAVQFKSWVKSLHGENDISLSENITKTNYTPDFIYENPNEKISSAWWYCCFPMDFINKNGLPMPVFFRCDDIEWSWRNFGEHHIAMNGICVWHSPFEWRVSKPVDWYFSRRNWHFANIIYTKNYKKRMLKDLKRKFKYLLAIYDYTSCKITIQMMQDLLNGDTSFRENPETLMKRIFKLSQEDKYEIIGNTMENNILKEDLAILKVNPKTIKNKILFRKYLYKLLLNGKLIPQLFWKKCRICSLQNMDKAYFYFAKQVNVYNLLTNKYEIRIYDRQKAGKLIKEYNSLYSRIDKNYDLIREKLVLASEEFKTEEFWNDYLKIER